MTRRLARRQALVVFIVGATLIAIVLAGVASRSSWRRVGYNGTPVQLAIGVLPAGAVGCEPHEAIPAGTGAVQVHATTTGTGLPGARITLADAGPYAGTGAPGVVSPDGTIVASLAHPVKTATVASLCVWNTGQTGIALYGAATGPVDQMQVSAASKPSGALVGRVRVEDLIGVRQRALWSILGRLPERIATATGSQLAPWLTAVGLVGGLLATGLLLLGDAGDRDET
jgi:hypothetical protein